MKKELKGCQGEVEKGDKVIYQGHLTLVGRPHGKINYDVVVSKNAAVIMYIDDEDYVYLTKQYRPAMMREVIAFPAETLDKPHLTPLEVIVEGLEEECGIRINPKQVNYLETVNSTDGHDTEMVHLFYAYGKGEYVGQRLEDSEKIEVIKIKFDEAYEMMKNGEIQGSKTNNLLRFEKLRRNGLD
jgi:hypothetical protein